MIVRAGFRVFRGSTLFLAGVGVGSLGTAVLIAYTIDQHGETMLTVIQDLKDLGNDIINEDKTPTPPNETEVVVIEGDAVEEEKKLAYEPEGASEPA